MICQMSESQIRAMRLIVRTTLTAYDLKTFMISLDGKEPSKKTVAIAEGFKAMETELESPAPNLFIIHMMFHQVKLIMAQPEIPFKPGPDAEVVTVNMKRNQ